MNEKKKLRQLPVSKRLSIRLETDGGYSVDVADGPNGLARAMDAILGREKVPVGWLRAGNLAIVVAKTQVMISVLGAPRTAFSSYGSAASAAAYRKALSRAVAAASDSREPMELRVGGRTIALAAVNSGRPAAPSQEAAVTPEFEGPASAAVAADAVPEEEEGGLRDEI